MLAPLTQALAYSVVFLDRFNRLRRIVLGPENGFGNQTKCIVVGGRRCTATENNECEEWDNPSHGENHHPV